MASNSSWKKGSTNASQIQKNWSTYKSNKSFKKQLKRAEKKQPTYTDAYKSLKNGVVNNLENREFEFDTSTNPVYQAYANDYRLLGNVAAGMSADNIENLSGGYGTTYSGTVAQQGLEGYLANEKAIIPSLYQQERNNYQADTSNLVNKGNLYNALESQDFQQFQDKLAKWNANREYAYNKWYNDYMASAKQHELVKSKEVSRETEGGTSVRELAGRSGSGRRGGTTKLNATSLKSREGAMAYLSNKGLDASNVMSKEQFEQEANRARVGRDYARDKDGKNTRLDEDYSDYLLNYIRQAQGLDDTDWFTKRIKKAKGYR